MSEFISAVNGVIWGNVLVYLLLGAGLYFTVASRFVQLRRFGFSFKYMLNSRSTSEDHHISSFQAFCTSLAARVGTGNLAGVAVAIYTGGPGAIFWMWLIALLGMSTSFVENTLAQIYKSNKHDGTYYGGPAYYIEKAMGIRWLGIAFSISLIIAFGFAFNSVQSNSIAAALSTYDIPPLGVGIALAVVTAMIIFGGIRSISRFAEMVVPFMALLYIVIALVVMVMNIAELPAVFALIFKSAFGLESAVGGGAGYLVSQAIQQGVTRGLFSNEAGMGSGPNAAATATPVPHHPATQGLLGMVGVFVDTIVICSATAAIILLSGQLDPTSGVTGINLTQQALSSQIGAIGHHLIALAILLFAFTSVIANYYYGESNLRFICNKEPVIMVFRVLVLGMVVWGAVGELPLVWSFADMSMGIMALINLVAIIWLARHVFPVLKDFDEQIDAGLQPEFDRKKFPFLDKTMDQDVWDSEEEESCRKLDQGYNCICSNCNPIEKAEKAS
ncbi:alanine/glycine:cation symporter family protein [Parendozoicomonas haliclonae]|uniref:Amino-acid carrier protein AlsT n=1 Tax=Parendozoicomonas haliclonae TaxID=1960125 RepID=A0A1X7AMI3_9GAMM|nr:sodium:alanine symporter family protein [Parendozoicomonas haliclonae]SMA49490.1 Amino-acid carrier protein AlsT [Parendozoicomonas haliclonae]